MFARAEDPYQNTVLTRLANMHTLVRTQATETPNPHLNSLADVLDNLQQALPHFFSTTKDSEKLAIVQSLIAEYHLIHIDDKNKDALIKMTRIGAQRLTVRDPAPVADLTADGINNFYIQAHRIAKKTDIRAPHALILFKDKLYHYNNSAAPAVLIEIAVPLDVALKEHYKILKKKLSDLEQNRIHTANKDVTTQTTTIVGDRTRMAALLGIPVRLQLQRINLELVASVLESFQVLVSNNKKAWYNSKQRSISHAIKAAAFGCILACVMYPFVSFFIIQLCLLGGGLLLTAGFGFALYCHLQERFYARLIRDLTQIDSVATYPGATLNTSVKSSLNHFFMKHKDVLDTAFTEENHTRAHVPF